MRTLLKLFVYGVLIAMVVAVIMLALLVFGDDNYCPSGNEESDNCVLPAN